MTTATPNKVLEGLRLFSNQWKNANADGGGSDWPEPGSSYASSPSYVTILRSVTAREMPLKISKEASLPGFLISLKFQLVDDPERETPRQWSDSFRFFRDEDFDKLPEGNQQGASYDRDRFAQFAKVITGSATGSPIEVFQRLEAAAATNPVLRQKIVAKDVDGTMKYHKGYPQELIPQ